MAYSDAQKEATARYNKKAYDFISVVVPKGKRKRIADYAAAGKEHEPLYQRRHRRADAAGKTGRIKIRPVSPLWRNGALRIAGTCSGEA